LDEETRIRNIITHFLVIRKIKRSHQEKIPDNNGEKYPLVLCIVQHKSLAHPQAVSVWNILKTAQQGLEN
jgi:hypothetical protein